MSIEHLTVDQIEAELQKRKAADIDLFRRNIAAKKNELAALEIDLAKLIGEKPTKAARTREPKIGAEEADKRVLDTLDDDHGPRSASVIANATGISSADLKASLARLEAAGKIKRTGKARGTVYGVA